jgi:hypothetical protein
MTQNRAKLTNDEKNSQSYFAKASGVLEMIQHVDPNVKGSDIAISPDDKAAYLLDADNASIIQVWDIHNKVKKNSFKLKEKYVPHKIAINNKYLFLLNKDIDDSEKWKINFLESSYFYIYIYDIKNFNLVKKLRIGNRICPEKLLAIEDYLIFDCDYYRGPEIHIVDLTNIVSPKYIERLSIPRENEEDWDLSFDLKFISKKGQQFVSVFLNEFYKSKYVPKLFSEGSYGGLHLPKETSSIIAGYIVPNKRKSTFTHLDDLMLNTFETACPLMDRNNHFDSLPQFDVNSIGLAKDIYLLKVGFMKDLKTYEGGILTLEHFTRGQYSFNNALDYFDKTLFSLTFENNPYLGIRAFPYFFDPEDSKYKMLPENVEKFKSLLKTENSVEDDEKALFFQEILCLFREKVDVMLRPYKEGKLIITIGHGDVYGYNKYIANSQNCWFRSAHAESIVVMMNDHLRKIIKSGYQVTLGPDNRAINLTIIAEKIEKLLAALQIDPASPRLLYFDIKDNTQYDLVCMKRDFEALNKEASPVIQALLKKGKKCSQLYIEECGNIKYLPSFIPSDMKGKLKVSLDIAKAIYWCHQQGVFYGSITPSSILLNQKNEIKLKSITQDRYFLAGQPDKYPNNIWPNYANENLYNPKFTAYCAPELLGLLPAAMDNATTAVKIPDEKSNDSTKNSNLFPTEKSDIYSFGRLIYFIRFHMNPWSAEGLPSARIMKRLIKGDVIPSPIDNCVTQSSESTASSSGFFSKVSKASVDIDKEIDDTLHFLAINCCHLDPKNRLTFVEVLARLEAVAKKIDTQKSEQEKNLNSGSCTIV